MDGVLSYRELNISRKFGIELELAPNISKPAIKKLLLQFEVENSSRPRRVVATPGSRGWAHTHGNSYWHVKYDSTCGPLGHGLDSGWEVASFIGESLTDLYHIASAAEFLGQHGVMTNNNCALHIHVDVSDFNTRQMGVLLSRWIEIEKIMFALCGSWRWRNIYCTPLGDVLNNYFKILKKKSVFDVSDLAEFIWLILRPADLGYHENLDKRRALNTIGYTKHLVQKYDRPTIELRIPECRLDKTHIVNWTKLYLSFIEQAKQAHMPETITLQWDLNAILHNLGLLAAHGKYVFLGPELLNTKIWFLRKLIASNWRETALLQDFRNLQNSAAKLLDFISEI